MPFAAQTGVSLHLFLNDDCSWKLFNYCLSAKYDKKQMKYMGIKNECQSEDEWHYPNTKENIKDNTNKANKNGEDIIRGVHQVSNQKSIHYFC